MSDYFIGEIRLFPYNRIPAGWHLCDGTVMQIQGNQALYSLIGTYYGGDGQTTFKLPDLRGRVPFGQGVVTRNNTVINVGNSGGANTVQLTTTQIPAHTHTVQGATVAGTSASAGSSYSAVVSKPTAGNPPADTPAAPPLYIPAPAPSGTAVQLNSFSVGTTGGNQGHENRQRFLALNYCIATSGIYPTRP